ncbi:hypothetical protein [Tautonia plasticadhaerens]|uniref:DUF4375 domain-containing protein n=1 Tax=Tautonia plasticadhaerens TaxID=2527974 RepID=A0A518GZS7_9BACT|nr:hypothetical protein [Tautonia plasticadhaerens]QDV34099.1 hypothetical protein ElP_19810 [Tautonia plasticadhaerens]
MSTSDCSELDQIGPLVDDYADHVERWRAEHDAAEACDRLGELLVLGVALSILIDKADAGWRSAILSEGERYDPATAGAFEGFYRDWLRPADAILEQIAAFEAQGHAVKRADQFRQAVREAKAVLTPDDEFFVEDDLADRRDEAVRAHQEGRTAEMNEFGA